MGTAAPALTLGLALLSFLKSMLSIADKSKDKTPETGEEKK